MRRGEIWWANLPDPRGSEPGYRRPVVIVSSNKFNESRIQTVLVASITSSLNRAESPGNFKLSKRESGLSKESVVNVSQIFTLDKVFLVERVARLSAQSMGKLEAGLRLVFSLD